MKESTKRILDLHKRYPEKCIREIASLAGREIAAVYSIANLYRLRFPRQDGENTLKVVALNIEYPDATCREIAEMAGCTNNIAHAVGYRHRLHFAPSPKRGGRHGLNPHGHSKTIPFRVSIEQEAWLLNRRDGNSLAQVIRDVIDEVRANEARAAG